MEPSAIPLLALAVVMAAWAAYSLALTLAGLREARVKGAVNGSTHPLPFISIIVPAKGEGRVIERAVKSLVDQYYPKNLYEVVIVEDGSEDETRQLIGKYVVHYPGLIKLLSRFSSSGKPSALNHALTAVKGDVVAVFDADSLLPKDALMRAAKALSANNVSVIQGLVVRMRKGLRPLFKVVSAGDTAWHKLYLRGRGKVGVFVPITGSCFFIRRDKLLEVNGWDEGALAEDLDLSLKLAAKGVKVAYAPSITSEELLPVSFKGLVNQRLRWFRGFISSVPKAFTYFLRRPSPLTFDALLLAFSPILAGLSMMLPVLALIAPVHQYTLILLQFSGALSVTILLTAALGISKSRKPLPLLLSIVRLAAYWLLMNTIALYALLLTLTRRKSTWSRTAKWLSPRVGIKLYMFTSYPPNRARLSEYAKELALALSERPSISKLYVVADKSPGAPERELHGKIEVLRVWSPDKPWSLLKALAAALRLKPQLVHFNSHFQSFGRSRLTNFLGLTLPVLVRLLGLRSVVTMHNFGELVDLEKVGVKPSLANRIGVKVATKLLAKSNALIVTVRRYIPYLRHHYGVKALYFVPHGVKARSADNCPAQPGSRDPKSVFTVLTFGHLAPYKGIEDVMEAAGRLASRGERLRLVVAGGSHPNFPGYLERLKALKPRGLRVTFTGYLSDEGLMKVFTEADVVVIPYRTCTGTSGAFHVACGFGKPIIASNLPEIKELLEDGARALLVNPGDIEGLEAAILTAMRDRKAMEEIGRANLRFASKRDWRSIASSYELIFLGLVDRAE